MRTAIFSTLLTVGLGASAWASTPLYIATDDSLVIDDFADGDMLSNQGGSWDAFSDVNNGGATSYELSIAAHTDENNNSFNALKLDFTLDQGGYMYSPWAEIQVKLGGNGSALNLSNCKEIRYDYRGGTGPSLVHTFRIVGDQTVYNVAFNYHSKTLYGMTANESGWRTASIKWSELKQAQWGEYDENGNPRLYIDGDLVKSDVEKFSWQVQQQSMPMGYGGSAVSESFEIANLRCVNPPSYIVSFYQGDKLLQSKEYIKGETPYYDDDGLYVDGKYKYWIKGWNPKVRKVTGDAVYHAVMDSEVVKSKVVFYDYSERGFWFDEDDDGYILTSTEYEYGSVPAYTGINPVRLPTVDSSYTFKGWGTASCEWEEEEVCYGKDYCDTEERRICKITYHENLPAVGYDDVHYYPLFDATVNEYTVKFVDYDGKTVLKSVKLPYGASVSEIVPTENPTRASSGGLDYTFSGWYPAIGKETKVNGKNDTYVATYTATNAENETVDMYTVTFMVESEVVQTGEYEYGDTPPRPDNPTKASTEMYDYVFKDWYDISCSNPGYPDWCEGGVEKVYGDKIYMALFDPQYRQYWVVFLDDDGSVIDSIQYEYEESLNEWSSEIYYLNKKSEEDGFEFVGWNPELHAVKGRTEYQAVYKYRVRFIADGVAIGGNSYAAGEIPRFNSWYDNSPTKSPTAEYTYEFIGWDKEFEPVTDTVTYNALFKPVPIQKATEVIDIAEGEFKLIDDFDDNNDLSELETYWFVYDDNDSIKRVDVNGNRIHYASEIAKEIVSGASGKAFRVTFKRDTIIDEDDDVYPAGWLGFGLALSKTEDNPVDISQCNAVQYDYKGSAHYFTVESKVGSVTEYVDGSKDWETNTIYPRDYPDYYYSTPVEPAVAFTQATYFIWSDMEDEGALEIDNVKCLHKPTYTVQFYNGETLVDEAVYVEDEMPSYNGKTDTDDFTEGMGNEQYTYYFDGWTPKLQSVTKNAVYRANIKQEVRTYRVNLVDVGNWYYLSSQNVEYGKLPDISNLKKSANNMCKLWVFDKVVAYDEDSGEWVDAELEPVTEDDMDVYVRFNCTDPVMYTVSFEDENGNAVGTPLEYAAGSWPNSSDFPDVPEKEPTAECTWRGYWNTQWGGIYSDRTYTPQYYCYTRHYRVKFEIAGSEAYSYNYVEYGTPYSDLDLSAPNEYWLNDGDVQYEFVEWVPSDENTEVKGDVTFTAKLNAKYAVRFVNYDDSPICVNVDDECYDERFYAEGTPFSEIAKPANPTRANTYGESGTAITTYTFAGWLPVIGEDGITEPMTFRAAYKSSADKYTVVFNISSYAIQEEFKIGSIPEFPYNVKNLDYADAQYTYTWKSWDRELVEVDGPAEYTAVFDSTLNKYEVAFYADDGVTPLEQDSRIYEYGTVIADPPTELAVAGKTGEYEMYGWCQAYYDSDLERLVRDWCGSDALRVTDETVYIPNIYYTIRFKDGNGETVYSATYRYGDNLEWTMKWLEEERTDELVKNPTAKYEYTWNGKWDDESTVVTGSKVYTALFDSTIRKYEIAFVDEDDTPLKVQDGENMLESVKYEYDTEASNIVTPAEPQKPSTEALTYAFAGWVLDGKVGLNKVTGAATYKASYTSATRQYTITFVGDDNTSIRSLEYPYMTKASAIVPPSAPDKSGFKFVGWKLVVEGGEGTLGLNDVTGPAKYKAEYVEENKFVVTWVNEDGTKLCDEEYYIAGTTPEYKCPTPTKEPTAANTYEFSGNWTPAVGKVTGDITYTATYTEKTRKYTVKFENYDGTQLGSPTEYAYGTPAANVTVPSVPERAPTEMYTYTFAGWMNTATYAMDVGDVKGDVTYRALFGNAPRMYTVTLNENGLLYPYFQYQYNTVVDLDNFWNPGDKEDEQCYYYFDKWVSQTGSNIVTGDMEYVPTYSECYKKSYVVTFFDPVNNIALSQTLYEYGTPASKIVAPTIDEFEVEGCTYTFDKWDTEIVEVKGNARYTAVYNEVCAGTPYVVTWVGADGKTITQQRYAKGDVPEYDGLTPSKLADEEFTYAFDGWSPDVVPVTEDATYTAKFKPSTRSYTVTFVDYNGTEFTNTYPYGTTLTEKDVPTFEDVTEGACTYSFDGWSPDVAQVKANARYTAKYKESCNVTPPPASSSSEEPMVSSSSEEPVVSSSSAKSSSSVTPPPASSSSETPVVSSSSAKSSSSVTPPPASSSSEEPAVSSSSEEPVVSSSSAKSSSSVTPPPASSSSEKPVESSSSEEPVVSSSSAKSSSSVTPPPASSSSEKPVESSSSEEPAESSSSEQPEESSSSQKQQYTVTWYNGDGSRITSDVVDEGVVPTYNGDTPTKKSTAKFEYTFDRWTPEVVAVTSNAEYKPVFIEVIRKYSVTFLNDNGDTLSFAMYNYDTPATSIEKPTDPTKTGNTFAGWDSEIEKVTGNATYKATYEKNTYTVTYYNAKGKVWQKDEYKYGEKLTLRTNSFTKEDVACTYAADGWTTTAPKTVTKDLTFNPKFGECQVKSYVVTFINLLGDTTYMEYLYGTKLKDVELPTLEDLEDGVCTLKFEGWDKELAEVTKALKLTAVYDSVCPDQSILARQESLFRLGFAHNKLTIALEKPSVVQVHVFDMSGQLQTSFSEYISGSRDFDLSQLKQGNFIVRVTSNSLDRTARIVVK